MWSCPTRSVGKVARSDGRGRAERGSSAFVLRAFGALDHEAQYGLHHAGFVVVHVGIPDAEDGSAFVFEEGGAAGVAAAFVVLPMCFAVHFDEHA